MHMREEILQIKCEKLEREYGNNFQKQQTLSRGHCG